MAYIPEKIFEAGVGHDHGRLSLCNETEGLVISTIVNALFGYQPLLETSESRFCRSLGLEDVQTG